MAFPDPEAITVTEHTRPVVPIRTLEDASFVAAPPLIAEITAAFHNRLAIPEGVSDGGGGDGGPCPEVDNGRPETGMLYPRG